VLGRRDAGDVPDLGQKDRGDGGTDARDRKQAPGPGVGLEERQDLGVGDLDLLAEIIDQSQTRLQPTLA
jgi:hypothetical protein